MSAADRLEDGFPHGTIDGFQQGCRGNGGCPNKGTARMTCVQAAQRYKTDLKFRRRIDAGEQITELPQLEALPPEPTHTPKPTPVPTSKATTADRRAEQKAAMRIVPASTAAGVVKVLDAIARPTPAEQLLTASGIDPHPAEGPAADDRELDALRRRFEALTRELARAHQAVDEYAAQKLTAEAETITTREQLTEALADRDRAQLAAQILREQVVESENRASTATALQLAAERGQRIAEDRIEGVLVNYGVTTEELNHERRAYRRLQAEHVQLQADHATLQAARTADSQASPQPGQLVVEQLPDGTTRWTFATRKPARILLGGLEVDIDTLATTAKR